MGQFSGGILADQVIVDTSLGHDLETLGRDTG